MSLSNHDEQKHKSNQIRRKRSQQTQQWLRRVEQRAEKIAEQPLASHHQKPVRRSYPSDNGFQSLPDIQSSEEENKHNKKFRLGWRILSFLLAVFFSAGITIGWHSPEYRVSSVEIIGLQRLVPENVLASLDISEQRIFLIDPNAIQKTISENFPELTDIKISLSLPAQVKVFVTERQPVLAWEYRNETLWVDAEGTLLPPRGSAGDLTTIISNGFPPFDVPEEHITLAGERKLHKSVIAKGEDDKLALFRFYEKIDPVLFQALLELQAQLPDKKIFLYDPRRGLGWQDLRGWQVFVGMDLKNISQKMSMYTVIAKKLTEQGIQPTLISVEYINAPYYWLDQN
ncbi:MAG TPA: FtsQ-type POTRA domain-containing protein [Anaerolineae bacterium]|nr:FtsQ-type POTRA domain-containing protein [Anaerolineae bacterium]